MEAIIYLIVIAAVLYGIYLLVVYVILPAISIAGIVAAAAGAVMALIMYIRAAIEWANPYALGKKTWTRTSADVYRDKHRNAEPNAKRRSYFFGPGFYSLFKTWITAWKYNFGIVVRYWNWARPRIDDIKDGLYWAGIALGVLFWVSLITLSASVLVVGSVVSVGIGLVHGAIMLLVASVVYLVFSVIYGIDYFYLWRHGVNSECPNCHRRYIIPRFQCSNPDCQRIHKKLIPSAYGILKRECVCGAVLPTTYFNGRSKLNSFCPYCEDERLASSDSRQFSVSLIGGSASGKTTMLASYFHLLREHVADVGLTETIPEEQERKVAFLEDAYATAARVSGTTVQDHTDPYTLLIGGPQLSFSRQFNIYDVAGEVFIDPSLSDIVYGSDFINSETILLLVDPLFSPDIRREALADGLDPSTISQADPAEVINNLANYIRQNTRKSGAKIERPLAVVINKTDIPAVAARISNEMIEEEAMQSGESLMALRNRMCRDFLADNEMHSLLMALDANFSKVAFFVISSTGGAEEGSYIVDSHLEEPFNWLLRASGDTELADAMGVDRSIGK